jgi:hypothetical protein
VDPARLRSQSRMAVSEDSLPQRLSVVTCVQRFWEEEPLGLFAQRGSSEEAALDPGPVA